MKDVLIALFGLLPFMLFIVWVWGYSSGYRDAKIEDRKDRSNCGRNCCQDLCAKRGSIGLGRGLTLGQMSIKKKGGVQ